MLRQDIQELQENLQEENRQKMNVLSKLRQTEDLLNELKDQLDDKEEERHKNESKLIQLTQQNNDLRRQAEQVNVEQMEELRRQFQREKETMLKQLDEEKLLNTKLTKSNQKFSNDIADVTVELERYRTIVQNVEKQQRSFDKRIQDEKILQDKLRQERDQNEREIREKETQRLNLLRDLEERNLAYDDLEKRFRQLRAELDDMLSRKDDIGKNIHELERIKRALGKHAILTYN
jgi:myosin protein heavy chain